MHAAAGFLAGRATAPAPRASEPSRITGEARPAAAVCVARLSEQDLRRLRDEVTAVVKASSLPPEEQAEITRGLAVAVNGGALRVETQGPLFRGRCHPLAAWPELAGWARDGDRGHASQTDHLAIEKLGTAARPLRVAVVGSGPSGFYAVHALFKASEKDGPIVTVDVFDRLPTPYGLVRGGVSPDHQGIKAVVKAYERIAAKPGFRFFGNVMLGRDLQAADLLAHYDQIVYATGNESDRRMNIPGEDLGGVHPATELVGWYNGHPDFRDRRFALSRARRVAVVGHGNVAIDVVRVLARDPEELAGTDIPDYALEALRASAVEDILLLGRRGPAQAAFSPKEIRELGALSRADLVIPPAQVELDPLSRRWFQEKGDHDARENVAYLERKAREHPASKPRRILCEFLVSPVEIVGADGWVTGVRLERNALVADAEGTPRPGGTGETRLEPVDLVFKAVGYRGVPIPGIPFDPRSGTFPNRDGRLIDPRTGDALRRQYVVGWAKRGPTGLIGSNNADSAATVEQMLADLPALEGAPDPSPAAIPALLASRGVDAVTWKDWRRLDRDEIDRGARAGKIREKHTTIADLMAAIRRLRPPGH